MHVYWLMMGCLALVICITTYLLGLNSMSHNSSHFFRVGPDHLGVAGEYSVCLLPDRLLYHQQINEFVIGYFLASRLCAAKIRLNPDLTLGRHLK